MHRVTPLRINNICCECCSLYCTRDTRLAIYLSDYHIHHISPLRSATRGMTTLLIGRRARKTITSDLFTSRMFLY